jgi:phosphatidylglycerophosphatase C
MRQVAAFDFDKTLSNRDNVTPFLRRVIGTRRLAATFAITSPFLVRAALMDSQRDAAKAAVLRRVLGGRSVADLARVADGFAAAVVEGHLRQEAVERATWHRDQGHQLVIVSASLALYLEPIARLLGFDAALGTDLAVGSDGRLTGELASPNVRHDEKVRRLEAWLGSDRNVELWAYGDSGGDRELLARADHPVRVRRGRLEPQNA